MLNNDTKKSVIIVVIVIIIPVTMEWSVLGLRMEQTASKYGR